MIHKLKDLEVLVLDCQATGANPVKGHLLEIAWTTLRATDPVDHAAASVQSHLVALPDDTEIPPRVERITGISSGDMKSAGQSADIWKEILKTPHRVNGANRMDPRPAVIHFSRFESAFLHHLHQQHGPEDEFPFSILCTHEIAKRLLPDLPRRGLRAIAGYFGHGVSEFRRSADHVSATAHIWQRFVPLLAEEQGIDTWEDLEQWLATSSASSRTGRGYPMDPKVRRSLPDAPGVYRMLRNNGDLLYIGKAGSLKKRVNSYFQKRYHHSEHILEMLSQARDIQTTITGSAMEAAILESDLIKRHSPPYNIALRARDRKLWFCSKGFDEPTHEVDKPHLYGPLPGKEIIEAVSSIAILIEDPSGLPLDDETCSKILCVSPAYGPDADTFRAGLEIFTEEYKASFSEIPLARAIPRMGTHLWRQHLADLEQRRQEKDDPADDREMVEEARGEDDVDKDDEPESEGQRDWTPESVSHVLEGIIRSAALSIRRARWYAMLSEATLIWTPKGGEDTVRRAIVFKGGDKVCSRNLGDDEIMDVSPGHRTPFWVRQQHFDIMTFDRMRIVTNELRRLNSESREMTLHLGKKSILGKTALARILPWV
ncbi:MAG: GIY-YIG nuclease family protein [Desulfobacterales bacterium]